ncbi:hypothetical protein JB92DRAFT_2959171 [Gautieria morchelliformis]|nr:hypothetical protein JB92DRAFT_2959171 [Gautieria morchelliformis]
MPIKQPPKVFQILAKTHRATVFLNAPHPTTIAALKSQALSALSQFSDIYGDVPKVTTIDDFEFCRATRQYGKIVAFDVLETMSTVRETLSNWEVIYFRFRNEHGKLQDVQVEQPVDEDDEQQDPLSPADVKGKRKAPPT